jgi:SAM-dependent methyltransferase
METQNNNLCIICTFLPLTEEYKNLWNRIADLLNKNNYELLLLTSSQNYEGLKFPVVSIPFSLKGFEESFGYSDLFSNDLSENDIHLIERDIFWNKDSVENYDKYLKGLFSCKHFYSELVKDLKPSFVFVWGNLLPQSFIFKDILENNGIPSFYLERGFFPGTLMIEDLLYDELNLLAANKSHFNADSVDYNYNKLKEFYSKNTLTKYPENHDSDLEKFILEKKFEGYKLITLYGTYDAVYFPAEQNNSKLLSTVFNYTVEAARYLTEEIQKQSKLLLVIKPHPIDNNDYSIFNSERVFVTKNFYNKKLIELSDLIIVGNSTIQYDALLNEKPILLIAKSALYNFNAAYIAQSKESFSKDLEKALNRKDFNKIIQNSKIFFDSLLKSHTYFYLLDAPAKSLEDLIEFITSNSLNSVNNKNLLERLSDFERNIFNQIQSSQIRNENKQFIHIRHLQTDFFTKSSYLKQQLENKLTEYNNYLKDYSGKNIIEQAEELIEANALSEAKSLLEKAISHPAYKSDALNDLAYLEIVQENYLEAFSNIISVLQINPNNEIALNNLNYLLENNKLDQSFVKDQLNKILLPQLKFNKFSSYSDFAEHHNKLQNEFQKRYEFELSLLPENHSEFSYLGYCVVCEDFTQFIVDYNYSYKLSDKIVPNWRERLVCPKCGLNNRMRLTYHIIKDLFPDFKTSSVYITEQTTQLFNILKNINPQLTGSEFLGNEIPFGSLTNLGIRNEDLTQLTFDDQQFDYIISLEVFEHIPDYKKALSECYRVLKQNGKLLFTVPFNNSSKENIIRATVNQDGSINHIFPPEYHGDPVNADKGCLCFYHFGWQILDDLKSTGFKNCYALTTYSKEYAYLGGEQIFFIAIKL